MSVPNYGVFDADNHLYEPSEVITEYLPKQYRNDIQFVQVRGRTRIMVKGHITEYMPNPTFEKVAAPGAHTAYYKGDNPEGLTLRQMSGDPIDCLPAFREPKSRMEVLDQLGLQRTLMFPTLANLLEYTLEGDPDLTHVAVHSVNEWLHDTWTFDYHDRIFAVPVITLPIVEEAIKELELVLSRGAKAILIRPGPVTGLRGSRSFGGEEFDPFWARVQEANVAVCMHASFPPLTKYYELWEPGRSDNAFKPTPLKNLLTQHREIEDAISALIAQKTLTRFPRLKIFSVENGAEWVGNLLFQLDLVYRKMPQEFPEHPVEVFRRNVFVNPFWEDDVQRLIGHVGADHVVFGSDYPHPEGLAEPLDYFEFLDKEKVSAADQKLIMSDNANQLLGLAAG
ncbi:MAG: amidohydrolase [Acidimicrobiia bacterium]|nr:amidohydrolase [Acidimicrobiia bacterium]